jgi:hypothetical protein
MNAQPDIQYISSSKQIGGIDELIVDAYNKLLEENHNLKSIMSSINKQGTVQAMEVKPSSSQREQELLEKNVELETELREANNKNQGTPNQFTDLDVFARDASTWVGDTFGFKCMASGRERALRFLEEAMELAQACDLSKADTAAMMDYVYSRPPGAVPDEIGGVLMTLAPLSVTFDVKLGWLARRVLNSCWDRQAQISQKHWNKPAHLLAVFKYNL